MVYFKLQLDYQELSNLTYKIPEERYLFVSTTQDSEEYFGIVDNDYYRSW